MIDVKLLPSNDNYIYLGSKGGKAFVVDPAVDTPVFNGMEGTGFDLEYILLTHHHSDHTDGAESVRNEFNCTIIGPKDARMPMNDKNVKGGDLLTVLGSPVEIFHCPGHTSTHIAFYFPEEKLLFCGDVVFACGCGRIFEGTPEDMYYSIEKLSTLPPDTLVFCGHENTESNLDFTLTIDPNNPKVKTRHQKVKEMRSKNIPTIPFTLAEELETNPYMRVSDIEIQKVLGLEGATPIEVFKEIRNRKDRF